MSKVYCIAGHGGKDPGAVANGRRESDFTVEIRNGVVAALLAQGVEAERIVVDADSDALSETRKKIAPLLQADDIAIDWHLNAATPQAGGVEVVVANNATPKELAMAADIAITIASTLGIRLRVGQLTNRPGVKLWRESARGSRGVQSGFLTMNGINLIVETFFITNLAEINLFNQRKALLFQRLAAVIINHLNAR